MKKASLAYIKEKNTRLIFRETKKNDRITRADLARLTELTPSTVSYITGVLLEKGILRESGTEDVGRTGRKGIMLEINYDDHLLLGYDVGSLNTKAVICNGRGDIIESKTMETVKGKGLQDQIETVIAELLKMYPAVKSVGMAFPGHVDFLSNNVVSSHNLGIQNFNANQFVEDRFGLPAHIDNNVSMMAKLIILNQKFSSENFVVVNLGPGIGSSIVFNNQILRGENNSAGEIGHLTVNHTGKMCTCGKRGCLETEASARAIVANYKSMSGRDDIGCNDSLAVFNLAMGGDPDARKAFERAGKYLGIALAHMVNILDPARVYICGGVSSAWELMERSTMEFFRRNAFYASVNTEITSSKLGPFGTAIGAALYAFEAYVNGQIRSR